MQAGVAAAYKLMDALKIKKDPSETSLTPTTVIPHKADVSVDTVHPPLWQDKPSTYGSRDV